MTAHLKQDGPVDGSALDGMAQGVLGRPVSRIEGLAKVTGTATYAAEYDVADLAEGVLVTATIPKGVVTSIDSEAARAMPGVLAVISDALMTTRAAQGTAGEAPVQEPQRVAYWGQPVALVVAETFEQARDAARQLIVEYDADSDVALDPAAATPEPQEDETVDMGDLDAAMKAAAHSVELTVETEGHASAAMEPHASIAVWEGDTLTVYAALQMLNYNISELADALDMDEANIRLVAAYVGGGFGSKLGISEDVVAAALAARALGRPVRVVMTRQQVFQCVMRRSETWQRLRLACDADGVRWTRATSCL